MASYNFIMGNEYESLKHLFQQEFSKMVAVISKLFGLQHIEIAEDIVSETFLQATETWGIKGIPQNPTAWLYAVAKQKTLYHFRRNKILDKKIIPELKITQQITNQIEEPDFSMDNNKETINKRLFRAKEKLRTEKVKMELPSENEIANRLDNVLHIIYLLFNEGYYSKTQNEILRKNLCLEALRLCVMLTEYERTNLPKTNALVALMCFHASRFSARETNENSSVLYEEQNEELWDTALIKQGMHFLILSARGEELSSYHLEARIAYWHCMKDDTKEKWKDILQLYNLLLQINYSPSVALNRTYALYK